MRTELYYDDIIYIYYAIYSIFKQRRSSSSIYIAVNLKLAARHSDSRDASAALSAGSRALIVVANPCPGAEAAQFRARNSSLRGTELLVVLPTVYRLNYGYSSTGTLYYRLSSAAGAAERRL